MGEMAHIRGREPGSARHDPDYQDVDGYPNLILMCPTHHTEIDNNGGKKFSVDLLLKLKKDHEERFAQRDRAVEAMKSYLAKSYAADDYTRFEQVDLQPRVDAIFVDVAVGALRGSGLDARFTSISNSAPGDAGPELRSTYAVSGGAQALLHPDWVGGALLVGGPGQGKTTLLQYVCQFHRARRLGKEGYTGDGHALKELTTKYRFPIRVELRAYVAWAKANLGTPGRKGNRRGGGRREVKAAEAAPKWPSLEQFLVQHVRDVGGLPFKFKDFTALVGTEPLLLALDGLDEVATLADREEVSRQVVATQAGLEQLCPDVVVLVATRPGAETSVLWSSTSFPQVHLLPLTQGLRLQYFQRWAAAARLGQEALDVLQEKLLSRQNELHVKELASTPMQLAILLHLLQRKGLLPEQRTALYSQYIETFLDREQGQGKEPLLDSQRKLIERVHEYLAWHLQSAVDEGSSVGSVRGEELLRLLREHLLDRPDGLAFTESLFASFEARVMCLVERQGSYEFDVQSLREYFAAVYIANTVPLHGAPKNERLRSLLARPYWSNVTRFFVGTLSPGEVQGLRYTFLDVAGGGVLRVHPLLRSMAFLLLEDRCFQGQPTQVLREMVDFILDGPGVYLAEDGLLDPAGGPLRFSDPAVRTQAVEHLKGRLVHRGAGVHEREVLAASLIRQTTPDDGIADWWWKHFSTEREWLEVASFLGTLDRVPANRRGDLEAAIREASRGGRLSPLLARVQGDPPSAIRALVNEVNAGLVPTAMGKDGGMLGRVLEASRGIRPSQSQRPPQRSRTRRVRGEVQGWAAIEQAAGRLAALGPQSSVVDWAAAVTEVGRAWGRDGWVIRDTIADTPSGIDLRMLAACVVDETDEVARLVGEEAARRESAGDADYWRESVPASTGVLALDWAVALLTQSHTSIIIQLQDQLEEVSGAFTPDELAVAIEAISRRGRTTALLLNDDLRLGRLVPSVPVLLLLRPAAEGATLEQVNKRLVRGCKGLDAGALGCAAAVADLMGTVRVDWFRGGRNDFALGSQPQVKLTGMTQGRATEIVKDPGQWPTFIVHAAARRLRNEIEKQEPLSKVAQRDSWFA
ncbi:MAG: hypothetical protein WAS01_00180 [Nostocoides sp.]